MVSSSLRFAGVNRALVMSELPSEVNGSGITRLMGSWIRPLNVFGREEEALAVSRVETFFALFAQLSCLCSSVVVYVGT